MSGCDFTSLSTLLPNAGTASVMSAQHSYIVRTASRELPFLMSNVIIFCTERFSIPMFDI